MDIYGEFLIEEEIWEEDAAGYFSILHPCHHLMALGILGKRLTGL
jgi:hypothetical protein